MTVPIAWIIILSFALIALLLLMTIIIQKQVNQRNFRLQGAARDFLFKKYFDQTPIKASWSNRYFFDAFIDIETQVQIDPDIRSRVIADILNTRFCRQQMRRLRSWSKNKRKIACFYINALGTDKAYALLEKRLHKEKNDSVFFYLVYSLIDHLSLTSINSIMLKLIDGPQTLRRWIYDLFKNHYHSVGFLLKPYYESTHPSIVNLLLYLSKHILDTDLKEYSWSIFKDETQVEQLKLTALEALASQYPFEVNEASLYTHPNKDIQRIAIFALASVRRKEDIDHLLSSADASHLDADRSNALSQMIHEEKSLILYTFDYYQKTTHAAQKDIIARSLSNNIDYFILRINSDKGQIIKSMIEHMMRLHIIEYSIDFLNHNKNLEIEKEMLALIKRCIANDSYLLEQFSIYLDANILHKIGLKKKKQPILQREKSPIEQRKNVWIILWVSVAILFFPFLYFVTQISTNFNGFNFVLKNFVVFLNYSLIYYFLTINTIYLILLLFSLQGAQERIDLWRIKKQTLLFEHDLLPSISIVAPAYNEEKSIIESVTSLLNLRYPKFEVIVVNDGSKDNTINVLIDHFELERKHPFINMKIPTKQLRGIYANPNIPNLTVIDKQNGGKADSLNLGINIAKGEYICGIDADSLLEEDALLKLTSVTLDDSIEHIALGGNIIPVNGCIVDKGKIEKRGLGKNRLVRFQTLEYLRAFTSGRIGWSKIRSLLIVSGAFGLFKRSALMETGGYLTISGHLKKDTVGEDMELIVRLTYQALLQKRPYRVAYVHHANCYTELPSDFSSLLKQRNRWQRGLLDILSYHRKILFNPKFKQPGLIGFPYFFIFEMMGPFLEMIGYLALIVGLSLGMLNQALVMVLFAVSIGFGIIISLFSLLITERKMVFYSPKESIMLIFIAILENFGYRQIMSLHRIYSTFSALKESGSWGSQKRQGFQSKIT